MIRVIDPGQAVATELHRQLRTAALLAAESCKPMEHFWTSGNVEHAQSLIDALWARPVHVTRLPEEYCSESAA
jgi:glutamate racemase